MTANTNTTSIEASQPVTAQPTGRALEKFGGQIQKLDLDAINRGMRFSQNDDFTISAGTITFNLKTWQILLILNKRYDIWQLPKGRKNVDESLTCAAVRETYEETGYRVRLLRTRVRTRATSGRDAGSDSVYEDLSTEPVGMISYPDPQARSDTEVAKMTFFYAATLDDQSGEPDTDTQDEHERLQPRWMNVDEAVRHLRFEAERKTVLSAEANLIKSAYGRGVYMT